MIEQLSIDLAVFSCLGCGFMAMILDPETIDHDAFDHDHYQWSTGKADRFGKLRPR